MTRHELRAARLALGLTQTELARLLSTNQNSISRWEIGKVGMPMFIGDAMENLWGKPFLDVTAAVINRDGWSNQITKYRRLEKSKDTLKNYLQFRFPKADK